MKGCSANETARQSFFHKIFGAVEAGMLVTEGGGSEVGDGLVLASAVEVLLSLKVFVLKTEISKLRI